MQGVKLSFGEAKRMTMNGFIISIKILRMTTGKLRSGYTEN